MIQIDYQNHPKKSFLELIKTYASTCLVLDDVLSSPEAYTMIYQDMLDMLKYGIEIKHVREFPISFVFRGTGTPEDPELVHTLECRHFLSNMVMWYAFMEMECPEIMDESYIIDWKGKSIRYIADYIDEMILPNFPESFAGVDDNFHKKNAICDEIMYHIKAISDAFCLLFGYSASIYDIMMAERQIPEIHDILYSEIDPNMQIKEMEEHLETKNKRLMELFTQADSDLRPLLKSGKNISANQFQEIFLRIGYKSDISNRTIPFFIPCNLLITGIDTPAAFYQLGESGRKALMNTKLSMSKPGALSKKMNHNATPVVLRKDYEWCDSTRPVYYFIEDDKFLEMLDRRYYYDEQGNVQLLDWTKDKHLIGKRIGFRSPCTCNSKDGICEGCYGTLFDINSDLFSQGSLAATKDSEPVGQLVLSQKHEQHTSSDQIKFDDEFYNVFDVVSSEVTISENDQAAEYLIKLGKVYTEETDDGDVYYVDSFDLIDYEGNIISHIEEENGSSMYLNTPMVQAWKQLGDRPIPIARFDDDDGATVLFNIEVKSKAVTQSLQLITAALDSKDHLGCTHDVDGLCQKFGRIMVDAGIQYNFVHHEMVIRSLMRKADNDLEWPDFGPNGDHENYTILRLTSSLSRNQSPLIRLSTGWLKKSLISTALYKSHAPSHLDALFVPKLTDVIDQ